MTVCGQRLSDTKNFKNKMSHFVLTGKFLSASECERAWDRTRGLQALARGGFRVPLAVRPVGGRCSAMTRSPLGGGVI